MHHRYFACGSNFVSCCVSSELSSSRFVQDRTRAEQPVRRRRPASYHCLSSRCYQVATSSMISRTKRPPADARHPATFAGITVLMLALLVSLTVDPFDRTSFSVCLFNNITGLPCAACGLTRACIYLAHGQIAHAAKMNPLVFPVTLLLLLQFLRLCILLATSADYQLSPDKITTRILIGLATAAVCATWLAKLGVL